MSQISHFLPRFPERGLFLSRFAASSLMLVSLASAQLAPGIRNFDRDDLAATLGQVPTLLSGTGLYKNIGDKAARAIADTNAIVSFEVNSALWSDGSHKERFISLPPGGAKVIPTDTSRYTFPAKTVLIKNFLIDTVHGNPASRIYVETRFLVFQSAEKQWSGLSYKWRRNQSDADLVSPENGEDLVLGVRLNGTLVGKRWRYPSMEECNQCHMGKEAAKRGTLGFITPQLNRIINGTNQLQRLVAKGVLSANPIAGKTNPTRWYGLNDSAAANVSNLERRVRSYFAANCSHCHGNGNVLVASHNFDYFNPARKITTADDPVGGWVGPHPGGREPLVVPGHPDSSLILAKMMHRADQSLSFMDISQMPPIATSQPDSAAVKLIKDWICALKTGTACKNFDWLPDETFWAPADEIVSVRHRVGHRAMAFQPQIRNGLLSIPADFAATGNVRLRDYRGRSIAMQSVGKGEYRIPSSLNPGVYILIAGSHRVYMNYLP